MKKDKKQKIGIITVAALTPVLTAGVTIGILVANRKQPQVTKDNKTVKIVSDINNLSVEEGQTLASEEIEAKCYGEDFQEIAILDRPKIYIYDKELKESEYSWITIDSSTNKVMIDSTAPTGNYTFYLRASCTFDNEIVISDFKPLNVEVKSTEVKDIDKLTLDVFEYRELPQGYTKDANYTLRAWKGDQEVEFPTDRKLTILFWCTDPSNEGYIPPALSWVNYNNEINLKIVTNEHCGLIHKFNLHAWIYFEDDPTVCFSDTQQLNIKDSTVS